MFRQTTRDQRPMVCKLTWSKDDQMVHSVLKKGSQQNRVSMIKVKGEMNKYQGSRIKLISHAPSIRV